jgi:hypothetical protein
MPDDFVRANWHTIGAEVATVSEREKAVAVYSDEILSVHRATLETSRWTKAMCLVLL